MPSGSILAKGQDAGLLILRAGVGLVFLLIHGFPRLMEPGSWARTGRAISYLGIDFGHQVWGFAAILSMTLGAIFIIVGFLHRTAALTLAGTMFVAAIWRHYPFGGWEASAYPVTMVVVCVSLCLTGPGKYALSAR